MSSDHNMNQTDSGWRKRQIALDKMAENARELGLDYNKTIMEMARETKMPYDFVTGEPINLEKLEAFAELVRADEAQKYKWDIHSCGPTCTKVGCVAMREAVLAEREACAKIVDEWFHSLASEPEMEKIAEQIRARGQA